MTPDSKSKNSTAKKKGRASAAAPAPDAALADAPEVSFEEALERLEGIVDRLEQGDLELEDSLTAFEEGVALTRRCAGQLEAAERRIEVLVKAGEQWLARPFEESEGDA
ncbi:MAG: exodeoxyribonuclease VII small subunit [Myxococcales bacterium]|nr:exodeoxyribonuclease VII small subunit [Myxococcales bacterium]